MVETVCACRETVTVVRVARADGTGPSRVLPSAGARLGRAGAGLLVAALGLAGARLVARAVTAGARSPGALPAGEGPRALASGAATGGGVSGRAA